MTNLLQIDDLTVRFPIMSRLAPFMTGVVENQIEAVADVSLQLRKGETYALVGESGSGKSTLARAVNGLVKASPGSRILFEDRDIAGLSSGGFKPYRREMSMVFQDAIGSLSPRMTVGALLVEPFQAHKVGGRDLGAERDRLLDLVGLPREFAARYPYELSGGQARRVGLARALALDPKLVIADEPTAGLDVSIQGEVLNLLNDMQQRLGLALLIITHNLHIVRHVAHRTGIMYLGRIVEEGPTGKTFHSPRHPYTRALLSASPKPDPDAMHTRIELKGEMPSLYRRPSGCEFHTRCPRAQGICATARPGVTVEDDQQYRCFFPFTDTKVPARAGGSLETLTPE
jgi:oligopeptide/dipeptide ABC transporter ATP-binding protein